jgi:hypothetical protein
MSIWDYVTKKRFPENFFAFIFNIILRRDETPGYDI